MKKLISIIAILAFSTAFSQNTKETMPTTVSSAIFYRLYAGEHYPDENISYSSTDINKEDKAKIYKSFEDRVKKNKSTPNYVYTYFETPVPASKLSFEELNKAGSKSAKYELVSKNPDYFYLKPGKFFTYSKNSILQNGDQLPEVKPEDISSVSFFEEWNFDAEKGSFTKDVKFLGASYRDDPDHSEMNIFNLKTNPYMMEVVETGTEGATKYQDINLFKEEIHYNVFFTKNKLAVDGRNLEGCFQYIPEQNRHLLIYLLLEAVYNNKIQAFEISDDAPGVKIDYDSIISATTEYERYIMLDDYGNELYDQYGQLVVNTSAENLCLNSIVGLRFHETWYFDKDNFSFHKKVNGISLLRFRTQNMEEYDNYKNWDNIVTPCFYLKTN